MNISDLVAWLQTPLFTLLATPVSWTEVLGFGSGAICVWLVARQHIANWPTGIANNLFFILLFTQAGLYADAGLQLVFITLAVYGWWNWARRGPDTERIAVKRTSRVEWLWLVVAGAAGLAGLTWLLGTWTDSTVPLWDALTTTLSLMATYGQCRKRLESWWLWIAADVVYVPLYAYKGLYLTSILYIGFMVLCVIGLRGWLRDLRAVRPTVAAA